MKKRNFYYKYFKIPTRDEMLNIPTDDLYDIHTHIDENKGVHFKTQDGDLFSRYMRGEMTTEDTRLYLLERKDWNEKGSKPIEDWLGISEKPKEMN